MRATSILLIAMLCIMLPTSCIEQRTATWTIVGAGPAGIAAIGLLIDCGITATEIAWIDPEFNVGRLSAYANVPANAPAKLLTGYIKTCECFAACKSSALDYLLSLDQEKEYLLKTIVDPLQDITHYLKARVMAITDSLVSLDYHGDHWFVGTQSTIIQSSYVILATGSHPRSLNYDCPNEIPMDIAIDKEQLRHHVTENDTVAVIGSAHSAILITKYLTELPVARIINFYKRPLIYPTNMGDWILYENTGLKGETARWAQTVLEKNPPANLLRIYNSPESCNAWLPMCTKIIYACGFDRNDLPTINGDSSLYANYDTKNGIIAHRLFGLGIAFPEILTDPQGNTEPAIGLLDFMEYAQRMMPSWMKKNRNSLIKQFSALFTIRQL